MKCTCNTDILHTAACSYKTNCFTKSFYQLLGINRDKENLKPIRQADQKGRAMNSYKPHILRISRRVKEPLFRNRELNQLLIRLLFGLTSNNHSESTEEKTSSLKSLSAQK